jgi:rhamnulokinase
MGMKNYVAFDCGNSSIRVLSGHFDGEKIKTELVHQVPNEAVKVNDIFYWDILHIFKELQIGLQKCYLEFGPVESVGISTWGIDFGLLGKSQQLLGNPLCYRNTFGKTVLNNLSKEEKDNLFNATGILDHPMNSLYQILGIREFLPEYYKEAEKLLLIPDLLAWLFTGRICGEPTIASTTQLLNMRNWSYSSEVMNYFELNDALFPPLTKHGETYGYLKQDIAESLKINECPFVSIPSHDTASAVVSVPAESEEFLFISSGTWSLIGTELKDPIINSDVYGEGFANEGGALDTITFLKNSAGMHILQNIKREMEKNGRKYSWNEMVSMAESCSGEIPVFDPNDHCFYNPPNMPDAICTYTKKELSAREVLASTYISLACSYKHSIEKIEKLSKKKYNTIHIVGGGCKNNNLNQLTSDLTGKSVVAGPVEATSLGNIGIQLKRDHPELTLGGIRKILRKSIKTRTFTLSNDQKVVQELENYYNKFQKLF